ncbi:hypothetical protein [Umezawaea beigongshangensis]|uniref:hypothetical protein n=1 Tax=Umezawaea beigongshangensis TaxID=2780383 RepID=UPI0018F19CF1|nr:hypothetical protein [Umezawaea beigongshangensis]
MTAIRGRTHTNVRHAGSSDPVVSVEVRRRAVRALAGSYAHDADDLVELLEALGLKAEEGCERAFVPLPRTAN